jgi:hypothetical protein
VAREGSAGAAPVQDLRGRRVVAGRFTEPDPAVAATDDRKAGFRPEDVGVALRDRPQRGESTEEPGPQAGSGAVAGLLGGGLLGGTVGFLVGLDALALPGIGPVAAGGALALAFGLAGGTAGAGAGIGAAAGALVGALVEMGLPEVDLALSRCRGRSALRTAQHLPHPGPSAMPPLGSGSEGSPDAQRRGYRPRAGVAPGA